MARTVHVPGAEASTNEGDDPIVESKATKSKATKSKATESTDPRDAEIAALKAQLADAEAAKSLPKVVYEPLTPHGKAALEASDFKNMTTTELVARIDAGEIPEPKSQNVLCSDGWYARRV